MRASSPSLPEGLEEEVSALAAHFGITGMSVALVTPDLGPRVLVSGHTTDSLSRPVDAHTPFSIASSAKHATALAVLELAQAGRLALEDLVERWVPQLPEAWRGRSLADLMHHTSGLPDYLTYDGDAPVPIKRDAFLAQYAGLVPYFDRNQAWCYSNTNYILLGFVITAAAGESYADAIRHRLLEPAGCTEVAPGGPTVSAIDEGTWSDVYARIEAECRAREVAGDGDLVLSAVGALQWHRVLADDVVLDGAMRARMVAPGTFISGRPSPYGCGWFLDTVGGRDCHHHAGHFDGWTAFFYRMPAAGAAVYLMSNIALRSTRAQRFIAQRILEACVPGSTPLSLVPIADVEPALTCAARALLIRPGGEQPGADAFALEQRLLIERVQGMRSVLNLWTGEEPSAFVVVEEMRGVGHRFRRYRIEYAARIEHVLVGYADDDRIFWAWPL